MRKQLGILASLLLLSVSALLWAGCSGLNRYDNDCCQQPMCEPRGPICPPQCQPECPPQYRREFTPPQMNNDNYYSYESENFEQECPPQRMFAKYCPPGQPCAPRHVEQACPPPCAPRPVVKACPPPCPAPVPKPCNVCPPPPCPAPVQEYCPPKCAAPLKPCKYGPAAECGCNGVTVRAKNQKMCMLGDQYPLDIEIHAACDVCEVIITTTLPEGVTYMKSQPEARVEGRNLTWTFGHISKGQVIPGRIWLKCEREGDLCTCFCVKATPVAFCALLCAKPVLVCEKRGTAEACPGDPIHYTINVTNIGTCTAEEVVVNDILPDGVEHACGQSNLTFKLGNLEPCQTKKVNVTATARKRGNMTNTAIVSACNANQTSCEFTTCVCCCAIECEKVGPKEVLIGQNADYQITVINTGDKVLHEVVVTDSAPSATTIVAAPGANINGKQAMWKLRELNPGQKVTFNMTLTTCTPGYFPNRVNVTNCEGCNSTCEFGTNWKGRPALDICITNSDNPICVGETSRFKVSVTNKGQEYDSNVNVVVNFPAELVPVSASGASGAQVNNQSVTFAPFPNLAPRQTIEYYVTVKANGSGDLRPKVQISSDFIRNPITQEESLIVN